MTQSVENSLSASGDVKVHLNDGKGWRFQLRARSGEISNRFTDDSVAQRVLQVETSSGDITVKE
jgi:hypothetical protein